jgi:hypothetical protein
MKKISFILMAFICQNLHAQEGTIVALNPTTNQWEAMFCDKNSLIVPNNNPTVSIKENFKNFRPGQLENTTPVIEVNKEVTSLKLGTSTVIQYAGEFAGLAGATAGEAAKGGSGNVSVNAKFSTSTTNSNNYEIQTSTELQWVLNRGPLLFGVGDKIKKVQKGKYGSMWCTKWKWAYNVSTSGWGWVLTVLAAPTSPGGPSGEFVFNATWGWRINVLRATEPMYCENNNWGYNYYAYEIGFKPGGSVLSANSLTLGLPSPNGNTGGFSWGGETRFCGVSSGNLSSSDASVVTSITPGYKTLSPFTVTCTNPQNKLGSVGLAGWGNFVGRWLINTGQISFQYVNNKWVVTNNQYVTRLENGGIAPPLSITKNGSLSGYTTVENGVPEPSDN